MMDDPEEVISGIFSLIVMVFMMYVVLTALSGQDIRPLVNLFTRYAPELVVGLLLGLIVVKIVEYF